MKMKKFVVAILMASIYSTATNSVSAQETASRNDSITNAIKLRSLQTQREKLVKEIEVEDRKRNTQLNGVSPERQEELNNQQDSICLSLRSQLVDVMLEIKETAPNVATPQLMQQYNNLLNRKKEENTTNKE